MFGDYLHTVADYNCTGLLIWVVRVGTRDLVLRYPILLLQEDTESTAAEIVEDQGLNMMTDPAQIEAICLEVVDHPDHAFKVDDDVVV